MKSENLRAVFFDEYERNKRLLERYKKELDSLPKGSIFKRKIGNKEYYYLNYRDGKKVISKFLGKVDSYNIEELLKNINHRNGIESLLKKITSEQKELEKEIKKMNIILKN